MALNHRLQAASSLRSVDYRLTAPALVAPRSRWMRFGVTVFAVFWLFLIVYVGGASRADAATLSTSSNTNMYVLCNDTTVALASACSGGASGSLVNGVGSFNAQTYEAFIALDLTGLGNASTFSTSTVNMGVKTSSVLAQATTFQIRAYNWGTDVSVADWVTPSVWATLPVCATFALSAGTTPVGYQGTVLSGSSACLQPGKLNKYVVTSAEAMNGGVSSATQNNRLTLYAPADPAGAFTWGLVYTDATSPAPTVTSTSTATVTAPPVTSTVTTTAPPVTSTTTSTVYTGQATVTPRATDFAGVVTLDDNQWPVILGGFCLIVFCLSVLMVASFRSGSH